MLNRTLHKPLKIPQLVNAQGAFRDLLNKLDLDYVDYKVNELETQHIYVSYIFCL